MPSYRLTFVRSARKELEALDATIIRRVFPRIEALVRQPRPHGCRKLQGESNLWRIRVSDYRIVYAIDDEQQIVDIVAVRHRSAAYQ